jgi:hypothetical protein
MGIHLLIVGEHTPQDTDIRAVYLDALDNKMETFKVELCASPGDLVSVVRKVALKCGAMIDVLDIHDHGRRGHIQLGGPVLFHEDGTGRSIARSLRSILTVNARVRLLGCETAVGGEGARLLTTLGEELEGPVVYGSLTRIIAQHFNQGVFDRSLEERYLFSSTEALVSPGPDTSVRLAELRKWYRSQLP